MRVAVTGGAGFIGKAVHQVLEEKGHNFVSIDKAHGMDVLLPNTYYHVLDECDAVIHLAGVLGTEELFHTPEQAIDVNMHGTLKVLEAARMFDLAYVGITMPDVWRNMYQATKIGAQRMAEAYHDAHGVSVSHVRAFNAFGKFQKVKGGPRKIIPTFATLASQNRPISIWGSGEQTVDLIHCIDIAHVLTEALDVSGCQVLDAGTGVEWTVTQVADMVKDFIGSEEPHLYLPMRMGEKPDTQLCAKGEGWEYLRRRPTWNIEVFYDVLTWYAAKPRP